MINTFLPNRETLPNLLIIGARKAGTTSLHEYLSLHPEIFMSKQKELSFFDETGRWHLGLDWYKSNFNAAYSINGESSPQYTRYPRNPGVPNRIKRVLGDPKLIYAIRDPIDRILSDYTQMVESRGRFARETRAFSEILENIENDSEQYLQGSSYFLQLSEYLKVFSRDQLHIVVLERLQRNPGATLKQVFEFLGVDSNFWSPEYGKVFNSGKGKRTPGRWFERYVPIFLQQQYWNATWVPMTLIRMVRPIINMGGDRIIKPAISPEEDLRLQSLLSADVARLREFLEDPLPEWRAYGRSNSTV